MSLFGFFSRGSHSNVPKSLPETALDEIDVKNKAPSPMPLEEKKEEKKEENLELNIRVATPSKTNDEGLKIIQEHESFSHEDVQLPNIEVKKEEPKVEEVKEVKDYSKEAPRDFETFFSHLKEHLIKNDLDDAGILEFITKPEQMLELMEYYHAEKEKGKLVVLHKTNAKDVVEELFRELEMLEREWLHKKKEFVKIEEELSLLEERIKEKVDLIKEIIEKNKKKELLKAECGKGKEFIFSNGRVAKNIAEMIEIIKTSSDDVFYHHVTSDRNDFANWIRYVFKFEDLAEKVQNVREKEEFLKIVLDYFYK